MRSTTKRVKTVLEIRDSGYPGKTLSLYSMGTQGRAQLLGPYSMLRSASFNPFPEAVK